MKRRRVYLSFLLLLIMATLFTPAKADTKIKLNAKSKTLTVGKTFKLKVKGTNKKVKWSSNKKSVATVTKKGQVRAKKAGTCTIKAKVAGKTLKCKIKVVKKNSVTKPSTPTKPAPVSNYDILVNTIKKDGLTDSDGNKYITLKDTSVSNLTSTHTITYDESIYKLKFFTTINIGSTIQTVSMDYGKVDTSGPVLINITYSEGNGDYDDNYSAKGYITPSTFTKDTTTIFTVSGNLNPWTSQTSIQKMCNSGMQVMIAGGNLLSGSRSGVYLRNIGFTNY